MPDQILGKKMKKTQFSAQKLMFFKGPPFLKYKDTLKILTYGLGIPKSSLENLHLFLSYPEKT